MLALLQCTLATWKSDFMMELGCQDVIQDIGVAVSACCMASHVIALGCSQGVDRLQAYCIQLGMRLVQFALAQARAQTGSIQNFMHVVQNMTCPTCCWHEQKHDVSWWQSNKSFS